MIYNNIYIIYIYISIFQSEISAPSRKVWPAKPLQIVADHLPALQPELMKGSMPGANCFKNTGRVSEFQCDWMNIYMNFWSFCFNDCSFLPHLLYFAPIKIRKNPRGRETIVFQALSCSGAFLLGSTLPIPPIDSPLTRCLSLPTTPKKNSVNSSEKQNVFGEFMLVCCGFCP